MNSFRNFHPLCEICIHCGQPIISKETRPYLPMHLTAPLLSYSPLYVLLPLCNFPFDFGGNAFFTNQRGSQDAPHPPSPDLLLLPYSSPPGQWRDKGAPIISLLVLIWAAQGFQVLPITPRNIITSSQGNTSSHNLLDMKKLIHRVHNHHTHQTKKHRKKDAHTHGQGNIK